MTSFIRSSLQWLHSILWLVTAQLYYKKIIYIWRSNIYKYIYNRYLLYTFQRIRNNSLTSIGNWYNKSQLFESLLVRLNLLSMTKILLTYGIGNLSIPSLPVKRVIMNGTDIDKPIIVPSNAIPYFWFFV